MTTVNVVPTTRRRWVAGRGTSGRVTARIWPLFSRPSRPPFRRSPTPGNNLIQLATAYQSSVLQTNTHGDSIQIVDLAYEAWSSLNSLDIYYVSQEIDGFIAAQAIGQAGNPPFPPYAYAEWGNKVLNRLSGLASTTGVVTLQPSPQTIQTTTALPRWRQLLDRRQRRIQRGAGCQRGAQPHRYHLLFHHEVGLDDDGHLQWGPLHREFVILEDLTIREAASA